MYTHIYRTYIHTYSVYHHCTLLSVVTGSIVTGSIVTDSTANGSVIISSSSSLFMLPRTC